MHVLLPPPRTQRYNSVLTQRSQAWEQHCVNSWSRRLAECLSNSSLQLRPVYSIQSWEKQFPIMKRLPSQLDAYLDFEQILKGDAQDEHGHLKSSCCNGSLQEWRSFVPACSGLLGFSWWYIMVDSHGAENPCHPGSYPGSPCFLSVFRLVFPMCIRSTAIIIFGGASRGGLCRIHPTPRTAL